MEQQLTIPTLEKPQIFPPEASGEKVKRVNTKPDKIYERKCEHCEKDYKAANPHSRFCSDVCRVGSFKRKRKAMRDEERKNNPPSAALVTPKDKESKEVTRTAQPIFQNISPHMAIAVQMLQKDADRWERLYEAQRKKADDLDAELRKLKETTTEEKYQSRLNGIEAAKPDFFDRFMSGLGNIPQPIIETLAPIIGRIAGGLMPPDPTQAAQNQIAGPGADPLNVELVQWLGTLDEQNKTQIYTVIGRMMSMDKNKLTSTLTQQINLFKNGQAINGHQQPSPTLGLDMSMYGG